MKGSIDGSEVPLTRVLWNLDRAFSGSIEPFRGSIEPSGGFGGTFWGRSPISAYRFKILSRYYPLHSKIKCGAMLK